MNALLLLDKLETLSAAVPGFETVNGCWLLAPTVTLPNDSDEEDREMAGAFVAPVKRSTIP